ncbi:MAG TPA: protein kinase [Polyangiaceae bacterium]|nr:protein kinase [Polyangiaceae bacterium]
MAASVDVSHEGTTVAPKPEPDRDPYLGREISGHIEIRELVGVGAMGRVYRAFQRGIDRDVAVKILHRELSANPQLVARFHREAKVASRLQHPNVVHVHLAGQLPDGALYIVMEYLDGMSLQSALVAANGPGSENAVMPLPRALHIALQLCDAVGEAHAQGIVHRDLKPENVMLVRRGEDADYVKVLDFGIARLSWGEQSMATAAGLIFGTARYISPEGAQGESVGPPGDVYAIATLLFQMLSGRTPFEGEQAVGILIQQIHDAPPQLKSLPLAASVPDALADIVMQNLAKDRNMRVPDARVLGRALLDVMRISGSSPRISGVSFPEVPSVDLPLASGAAPTTRWTPPVSVQAQLALPPEVRGFAAADLQREVRGFAAADLQRDFHPAVASGYESPKPSLAKTVDDVALSPVLPVIARETPAPPAVSPTPLAASPALGVTVRMPVITPPFAVAPHRPSPVTGAPHFPVVELRRSSSPSKPASNVETTLSDVSDPPVQPVPESRPSRAPRRFVRFAAIFFLLFLVGSGASFWGAYHFGYLQPRSAANNIEEILLRARKASSEARWDAPPGDNVQDLTNEGLSLWPAEPRLLDIRAHAGDMLMKRAIAAKASGDLAQAVRDLQLAMKFDPSDASRRELLREYESDLARSPAQGDALTLLADAGGGGARAAGVRAAVESSPPKPHIGQPVDFAAKIAGEGAKNITGARFAVTGPGLGKEGATLTAVNEGGLYRAGFTFLEPGRYEVTFLAKADGTSVRGGRAVVVYGGTAAPSTEASSSASGSPAPSASPAPSGSAKWL